MTKKKTYSKEVSVYDLKQAEKFNGRFRANLSNVQKSGMKISEEQAEDHNKNFDVSGSFYELNEKDTEKYLELVKVKKGGVESKETKED